MYMKNSRMLPGWLWLVIQRKSHVWTFQMKNRPDQLLQAYICFLLKRRIRWKTTDVHRRRFICISGFRRIQRMLEKNLHIQGSGKQKCMNAADSCCYNSGRLQETEAYILYRISFRGSGRNLRRASFTESASAAAEAHSRRAGGGESSRRWENKSVIMRLRCLDMLTPAE